MRITYYGHSSFLLQATDGTRVVIDPYRSGAFDGALRYAPIAESADAVVATHEHDDHNAADTISGEPEVYIRPTSAVVGPWTITGIEVDHDDEGGKSRGKNTIVILDDGDVRAAHLGDLGHVLGPGTIAALGRVDVLMVPVGGFFTIDHKQASQVVEAVAPRIVLPMHYKTPKVDFPITDVDAFLATQAKVEHKTTSTVEITQAGLPAERVTYVLPSAR